MPSAHFKKVCECGKLIAQCRCMSPNREVITVSPCTHNNVVEAPSKVGVAQALSEPAIQWEQLTNADDTIRIVADKAGKGVRYKIVRSDNSREYHTSDGLAFALGVACLEANLSMVPEYFWKVCHPNDVEIYHVTKLPSGQVLVTQVGA